MNKTLIAAAVSAALMAPVAAQADVTVYGRIHNGIAISDTDDDGVDSTTDLNNGGSRFGIKASSDLGNGLTVSAHYEFTTSTDTPGSGIANTRVGTVGISGGFGSVKLGNQWGAYYNNAAQLDPTYESPGILYYDHNGPLRTANTISYSNSFGPVSIQLDSRVNDDDAGRDGFAAGATIAVNDMISIGGAIDDSRDTRLTALQAVVSFGSYSVALARHSVNPDGDGADPSLNQVWVTGSWGNTFAQLGLGRGDNDGGDVAGNDPSGVTLGVYHSMGGGLTLMYEGGTRDNDGAGGDRTDHWLGMMYNF